MDQYLPDVTAHDMTRVIERDFPAEVHAIILEWIRQVEVREKTRIVIAALKNSKGNLETLKGELANASGWYREIISEAEYPNYTRVMFRIDRISPEEQARIIEKDKQQYLAWLQRTGPPETRGKAP
jgi:hypothetical protein